MLFIYCLLFLIIVSPHVRFFLLMIRRPPRSTRTDTLFPYTTLFRSVGTDTIISVAIDNGGNYSVTLSGPIDHPDTTQEDALSLVVPVSVFDGTTTVTNTTALTIGLEDDAPIAIAPLAAGLINAPGSSVYQSLDSDGDVDNNYGGEDRTSTRLNSSH